MKKSFIFSLLVFVLSLGFAGTNQIKTDSTGGCTNPLASNFNSEATFDDGSCILDDSIVVDTTVKIEGCTNPLASNFNSEATFDDGSCILDDSVVVDTTVKIEGCTNPLAINFDSLATFDDGSCILDDSVVVDTSEIGGCLDPKAINFDPAATFDNGSCLLDTINFIVTGDVYGCTDKNATNFDNNATKDNGSCSYSSEYLDTAKTIIGCQDESALTYNPIATTNNPSYCIYKQDTVNSKLTIDLKEITDTTTTTKNNCELDYSKLIDSARVKSVDGNNATWSVYQRGKEVEIPASYDKLPTQGKALMYLKISCAQRNANTSSGSRTVRDVVEVSEVVSLNSTSPVNSVILYPNPVSDNVLNISGDNVDYVIFTNSQGLQIPAEVSENNTIDMSDLSNGMYFISIHLSDGSVITDTIIKY